MENTSACTTVTSTLQCWIYALFAAVAKNTTPSVTLKPEPLASQEITGVVAEFPIYATIYWALYAVT